jgi:thimet oligopeptidase
LKKLSFKDLENEIISMVPSVVMSSQDVHFYASFGHLTGYGASYYSYLWSLVFAKELWEKIEILGVSSVESGELIKQLLSAGGMIHPDELLFSVLGSAPSTKAFEDFLNKK